MFVGSKSHHEITPESLPWSAHKIWSKKVQAGLTSNKDYVETLKKADGIDFSILNVASNNTVFLVDVSKLKNTIITTRVN